MSDFVLIRDSNGVDHLRKIFNHFRKSGDFIDVTIECQGHTIHAHKIILAAYSSYYRKAFEETSGHCYRLEQGVKYKLLEAAINWMYAGELIIDMNDVEGFENLAKRLSMVVEYDYKKNVERQIVPQSKVVVNEFSKRNVDKSVPNQKSTDNDVLPTTSIDLYEDGPSQLDIHKRIKEIALQVQKGDKNTQKYVKENGALTFNFDFSDVNNILALVCNIWRYVRVKYKTPGVFAELFHQIINQQEDEAVKEDLKDQMILESQKNLETDFADVRSRSKYVRNNTLSFIVILYRRKSIMPLWFIGNIFEAIRNVNDKIERIDLICSFTKLLQYTDSTQYANEAVTELETLIHELALSGDDTNDLKAKVNKTVRQMNEKILL